MPGFVMRKLVIIAAVDGLILQPQRNSQRQGSIKLPYGAKPDILPCKDATSKSLRSVESYGIAGILTVGPSSYLISISSRQQVALVFSKPIYVITGVAIIPLSSQAEAEKAIIQADEDAKKASNAHNAAEVTDSDVSDEDDNHSVRTHVSRTEEDDSTIPTTPESKDEKVVEPPKTDPSEKVVEDIISRKGQYGRFAERWFSKKGWTAEKRKSQGMSASDGQQDQRLATEDAIVKPGQATADASGTLSDSTTTKSDLKTSKTDETGTSTVADTLLPKVLRTTSVLFSSQSYYFSYDIDITRRLGSDQLKTADLPLHKAVDPLFFWNRHLVSPFIAVGQHAYVLPLLQGFVGQRAFSVNTESNDPGRTIAAVTDSVSDIIELQENASGTDGFRTSDKTRDFLITLVSRRSVKRSGLRYLRRGVDDEGHTANSVETEQILSDPSWGKGNSIYSFTQFRGSIPLYFSQTPFALKPVPFLQHSSGMNHDALRKHFQSIASRYGGIQIALLVDKSGGEANIGEQYEEHVKQVNSENGINGRKLGFEWFDFHNICRGMKFANVSILMDSIGPQLDNFGYSVIMDGKVQNIQSGVLRTNCMDCLDRTNVVQSACGQRALEKQLSSVGVHVDMQNGSSTQWFNTLWADNGDAISKLYANSGAMKSDYTRTGKRGYRGVLTDATISVTRLWSGIVNDFFSQAVIDYLLGNVTDQVFEDFEANMMSSDPAISMQKLRQNAIQESEKIVIEDQTEELIGGWTVFCPHEVNTVRTFPFEEAILLLTNAALYAVRFEWSMEKVRSFERVDIRSIAGIMVGTYITSTLENSQMDEQRNYGFVVKYRPGKADVVRVNTRSMSTAIPPKPEDLATSESGDEKKGGTHDDSSALASQTTAQADLQDSSGSKQSNPRDPTSELKILSFKALPSQSSLIRASQSGEEEHVLSERELVNTICQDIRRTVDEGNERFIEEKDIISLAEARKSTGLLEQWGHSLKKLVWA